MPDAATMLSKRRKVKQDPGKSQRRLLLDIDMESITALSGIPGPKKKPEA
jgi:hypothetical protein